MAVAGRHAERSRQYVTGRGCLVQKRLEKAAA